MGHSLDMDKGNKLGDQDAKIITITSPIKSTLKTLYLTKDQAINKVKILT